MRELDLRLARTTERARELKIMARQAAEQAERAAAGVATENKVRHRNTRDRVGTSVLRACAIEMLYVAHILLRNVSAVTKSIHCHIYVVLKPLLDAHV